MLNISKLFCFSFGYPNCSCRFHALGFLLSFVWAMALTFVLKLLTHFVQCPYWCAGWRLFTKLTSTHPLHLLTSFLIGIITQEIKHFHVQRHNKKATVVHIPSGIKPLPTAIKTSSKCHLSRTLVTVVLV